MKEIVILGGPKGAGKTTVARKLLPKFPEVHEFLNADEFARAISPENPSLLLLQPDGECLGRCWNW